MRYALDKIGAAARARILLACSIDSFTTDTRLGSQKQPRVGVSAQITMRYYDLSQKDYCWYQDTLKAEAYRTEKIQKANHCRSS